MNRLLVILPKDDYVNKGNKNQELDVNDLFRKEVYEKIKETKVSYFAKGIFACDAEYMDDYETIEDVLKCNEEEIGLVVDIQGEIPDCIVLFHDYYMFGKRKINKTVDEFIKEDVVTKTYTHSNFMIDEGVFNMKCRIVKL